MNEESKTPEQTSVQNKSNPAQTNFLNEATLYLIACGLCLVGFFLNWFSISQSRTYTNFDVTNPMNMEHTDVTSLSVTGTTIISKIWDEGGAALFLLFFIISIPLGALIIGSWKYYKREIRNTEICWISFMTLIPILLFSLYLFAVDDLNLGFINLGDNVKDSFGGGLWLMILGSSILIYSAVSKIIILNKKNASGSLLKPGLLGGAICSIIIVILTKIFSEHYFRDANVYYLLLPLIILSISIAIAVQNFKTSNSLNFQYSDIVSIGFITSLSGALLTLFLFKIFYSDYIKYVPTSLLIVVVILFTQLGFVVSSIGTLWTTNMIYTPTVAQVQNVNVENQSSKVSSQPSSITQRPQININVPKVDWNKRFISTKKFVSKNKMSLIVTASILIAFIIVYNLFIKPNPVKDAKFLAQNYCGCQEELNKNNLATMQAFLKDFDNKKYASKSAARSALNNLLQPNQTKFNDCVQQANMNYKNKDVDYNAKGGKYVYTFEQTYNSLIGACNSNNNDVASIQTSIDEKIKTIKDPEPDISKIEADLIGQKILGWNFDYVSEIKQANIVNTTRASDRIEYKIDLHMIGYTQPDTNPNDAEVIVTYYQTDYGWSFGGVREVYITYTNIAPVGTWQSITPLSNTTYSISNDKRFWIKDGSYGQTYKGGPDGDSYSLTSPTIFISSRETEPVSLIFTYYPKQ